jgi:hypothetical protein
MCTSLEENNFDDFGFSEVGCSLGDVKAISQQNHSKKKKKRKS